MGWLVRRIYPMSWMGHEYAYEGGDAAGLVLAMCGRLESE